MSAEHPVLFTGFLYHLRAEGLQIGMGEWVTFLGALKQGIASDVGSLYLVGRAVLCRSESEFDAYDVAFSRAFSGAELSEPAKKALMEWLAEALDMQPGEFVEHDYNTLEELWEEFRKRLAEQDGKHDGGNHWIGTGGTSPFGHSGRGAKGIRVGGGGGGRQAVQVAEERRWANYRTDRVLDVRQLEVALRALRNLAREGNWELDIPETIDRTCQNAGDIELIEQRERTNRVHLVLLMDAGGSMAPHYEKVSRLFSAAQRLKTFKTFTSYSFHNCVYRWLYNDIEQLDRVPTQKVLDDLTPRHRLIFVGDASMAPYELFSPFGWPSDNAIAGIDWLKQFSRKCPASVWLNPDPPRYWNHPTVNAIGSTFPMYELTVDGLRDAVKKLRVPV